MTPEPTALRWMWMWITIAILVVVVVIGFLFGIAGSLEAIDDGLAEADQAVEGAEGDVRPLPDHIQGVNAALVRVDTALDPLSGQADKIIANLGDIRFTLEQVNGALGSTSGSLVDTSGSLTDTSGSLVDTSGSLENTSGSLVDTSGELRSAEAGLIRIRQVAAAIERRLELAQNFNSVGTNGIWRRVRFLNGGFIFEPDERVPPGARRGATGLPLQRRNEDGLRFVERDADGITGGLLEVSRHLTSICRQLPLPSEPNPGGPILPQPEPDDPGTDADQC